MRDYRLIGGLIFSLVALVVGCGTNDQTQEQTGSSEVAAVADKAQPGDTTGKSPDWLEIEFVVYDVIERLRYEDKSGLYENEFEYFRAAENFDQYLGHGEVGWANADSLDRVEVRDITFFGRDSAWVDVIFYLKGPGGKLVPTDQPLMAYYHQGRWIKPYLSTHARQIEYEERIRQADEDSEEGW